MCIAVGQMPNGHTSAESADGSSSTASASGGSSTEEEEVEITEDPPADRSAAKASARPPEPRGSPPKSRERDSPDEGWERPGKASGKHGKGRGKSESKCGFCWKRVKGGPSAMKQHEWWSETCLTWQFHRSGYEWHKAKRMAAALKRQRMEEGSDSCADEPEPPRGRDREKKKKKEIRVDKSWIPGPFAHSKRRQRDTAKGEKKKKKSLSRKRRRRRKDANRRPPPAAALSVTSAVVRPAVTALMGPRKRIEMGVQSAMHRALW